MTVAYVRTHGVILRCTAYSESSQVVAISTPDMGQVHGLAKGSRRPRKDGRAPLDLLTHYEIVLARRAAGQLHIITDWSIRSSFGALRTNLRAFWAALYADEVSLCCTSETPDDGLVCDHLLAFLRRLEDGWNERSALFLFLARLLEVVGSAPTTECCAQCRQPLAGGARFSPGAGGALCGDCAMTDPGAFPVSRGALAIMTRLRDREADNRTLHIAAGQADEIQRAFNEQIQYHLGRPLRTARFLVNAS